MARWANCGSHRLRLLSALRRRSAGRGAGTLAPELRPGRLRVRPDAHGRAPPGDRRAGGPDAQGRRAGAPPGDRRPIREQHEPGGGVSLRPRPQWGTIPWEPDRYGRSHLGLPLEVWRPRGQCTLLLFAGIHGEEPETTYAL